MNVRHTEPVFSISIVARLVGLHAQTIRSYERMELVKPFRSAGNIRLYSGEDVERLLQIKGWIEDLGLNLAGVEVMTRLSDRVSQLEGQVTELTKEVVRLRVAPSRRSLPGPGGT